MIGDYCFLQPSVDIQPRRVKSIEVRAGALIRLAHMLNGERRFHVSGLPLDAKAIAFQVVQGRPDTVLMFIESSEFVEIGEGASVPSMDLDWREIRQ